MQQLLPGLNQEGSKLKDSQYYLRGAITESQKLKLYEYTSRVREITFTDDNLSEGNPALGRLSPQVFVRLAQLQDPSGTLFPNLQYLRFAGIPSVVDLLDLFLSPSLRTFDIKATGPYWACAMSFLENAIDRAPNVTTFRLSATNCPDHYSNGILDICFRYRCLQGLELVGVPLRITSQLLTDIGTLKHLQSFVFEEYVNSSARVLEQTDPWNPFWQNVSPEEAPEVSNSPSISQLFPVLKTLGITGRSDLIERVIGCVSSHDLFEISITFLEVEVASKHSKRGLRRLDGSQINSILNDILQKWRSTLIGLSIVAELPKMQVFTSRKILPASLATDIFMGFLCLPRMKRLEISGLTIDALDNALDCLKEVPSKLETLHLPFHNAETSIPLSTLGKIACACPHLVSFRSRFKNALDGFPSPVPEPLSNNFEALLVTDDFHYADDVVHVPKNSLQLARFIDSVFPNLKTIKTLDQHNVNYWKGMLDILKMCQAVRQDERQRFVRNSQAAF